MNALVRAFGLWATFILPAGAAISQASVTGGEVSGVFVDGIASKDAKESRSSETRMEDFPMRLCSAIPAMDISGVATSATIIVPKRTPIARRRFSIFFARIRVTHRQDVPSWPFDAAGELHS
jgi:hypothetical protein